MSESDEVDSVGAKEEIFQKVENMSQAQFLLQPHPQKVVKTLKTSMMMLSMTQTVVSQCIGGSK